MVWKKKNVIIRIKRIEIIEEVLGYENMRYFRRRHIRF